MNLVEQRMTGYTIVVMIYIDLEKRRYRESVDRRILYYDTEIFITEHNIHNGE